MTLNYTRQSHTTTFSSLSAVTLGSGLSGAALKHHFQMTFSALSAALEPDSGKNPGGNLAN